MQLGIVGLGRMGGNIARRLLGAGHQCVIYDRERSAIDALTGAGAFATEDLTDLVRQLPAPRHVWIMLPAGPSTEDAVNNAWLQVAELSSFRGYPQCCSADYNKVLVTVAPTRRGSVIRIQQET